MTRVYSGRLYEVHLEVEEPETTFTLRTTRHLIEVARGSLKEVTTEWVKRGERISRLRYEDWVLEDSEIYEGLVEIMRGSTV